MLREHVFLKACAKVESLLENNNLTIHCEKQKRKKFYVRNVEKENDRKLIPF